jgi:hypothetical protein
VAVDIVGCDGNQQVRTLGPLVHYDVCRRTADGLRTELVHASGGERAVAEPYGCQLRAGQTNVRSFAAIGLLRPASKVQAREHDPARIILLPYGGQPR